MLSIKPVCCAAGGTTFGRRLRSLTKWTAPGAILLIVPKCPLCIVAYVAMFTGVGLSVSTAATLRITLIVVSSAILLYVAASSLLYLKRNHNQI
ncbi:MAG TPA: hypothetical protein VJL58_02900 [Pyrinomonadaceae bacterium]|nr:hypothetical protein [Pyrinomonadaceae bacterium]